MDRDAEVTRVVPGALMRALAESSSERAIVRSVQIQEQAATVSPCDPRAEPGEIEQLDREMFERLSTKAYPRALAIAEDILALDPCYREALSVRRHCRVVLEARYKELFGRGAPIARAPVERLAELAGPCGTAFVFTLKGRAEDLASLLETSALPPFETLRVLYEMYEADMVSPDMPEGVSLPAF